MRKEGQQTGREQEVLEACLHSLMIQLVQTESLFIIRLCLGNHLVVGVEKVFCEATKHVHDPQSVRRGSESSDHEAWSVE